MLMIQDAWWLISELSSNAISSFDQFTGGQSQGAHYHHNQVNCSDSSNPNNRESFHFAVAGVERGCLHSGK